MDLKACCVYCILRRVNTFLLCVPNPFARPKGLHVCRMRKVTSKRLDFCTPPRFWGNSATFLFSFPLFLPDLGMTFFSQTTTYYRYNSHPYTYRTNFQSSCKIFFERRRRKKSLFPPAFKTTSFPFPILRNNYSFPPTQQPSLSRDRSLWQRRKIGNTKDDDDYDFSTFFSTST